jgi:hypothetical protein
VGFSRRKKKRPRSSLASNIVYNVLVSVVMKFPMLEKYEKRNYLEDEYDDPTGCSNDNDNVDTFMKVPLTNLLTVNGFTSVAEGIKFVVLINIRFLLKVIHHFGGWFLNGCITQTIRTKDHPH